MNKKIQDQNYDNNELIKQAIHEAFNQGINESNQDLNQKINGIQGRIDGMNINQTVATRQATADHSKIKQLEEITNKAVNAVNYNSRTEQQLIDQLQKPITVDGNDVLHAINEETNSNINQLITKKVANHILNVKNEMDTNKNNILENQKAIRSGNEEIYYFIKHIMITVLIILLFTMIEIVIPGIILKAVMMLVGIIGGYYFGTKK